MDLNQLIEKRDTLRLKWQKVRMARLNLRDCLLQEGATQKKIRSRKEYKEMKKSQAYFSKRIKHLDSEINKKQNKIV